MSQPPECGRVVPAGDTDTIELAGTLGIPPSHLPVTTEGLLWSPGLGDRPVLQVQLSPPSPLRCLLSRGLPYSDECRSRGIFSRRTSALARAGAGVHCHLSAGPILVARWPFLAPPHPAEWAQQQSLGQERGQHLRALPWPGSLRTPEDKHRGTLEQPLPMESSPLGPLPPPFSAFSQPLAPGRWLWAAGKPSPEAPSSSGPHPPCAARVTCLCGPRTCALPPGPGRLPAAHATGGPLMPRWLTAPCRPRSAP